MARSTILELEEELDPPRSLSLLSREAALALAGVFLDRYEMSYPIVSRHEMHMLVSAIYDDGSERGPSLVITTHGAACSRFLVHMMAAVGLLARSHDKTSVDQAGLLHAEAMAEFGTVMQHKTTQTVQCLFFVLLWSLVVQTAGGLSLFGAGKEAPAWQVSGLCMRMCVDMGMHTEAMIQASTVAEDVMKKALKRRLFWVASKLDQTLGGLLGHPQAWHEPQAQIQTATRCPHDETASPTTASFSGHQKQKSVADQPVDEPLWDSSELYDSFCNTPEGTWNTDGSTEILAMWDDS
ncbi:hypothetical protein SCUCBS95973_006412 [Sporothrix curviconia]|uniref:Xylanolytic transcriptional activator regulatory domain-containing protein n=1 Tax=Sporothrix curviconia TaxID=1260050 RepID=A0ABP0C7D1_9PEZI